MADRAELERRAKVISEHEDQGQINGCGHEYFIGEMCGQCDDIARALERVQRETAERCAVIAKEHDALGSGAQAIRAEFGIEEKGQ